MCIRDRSKEGSIGRTSELFEPPAYATTVVGAESSRQVGQGDGFRLGKVIALDVRREFAFDDVEGGEVGLDVCGPGYAPAHDRLAREVDHRR